jgi:hypothetical protein
MWFLYIFGDNILLYIFNIGTSGGVIEKNPVISFLAYCYLLFLIKDFFQKRIKLSDTRDLVMVLFTVWLLFGAAATIFSSTRHPASFFSFISASVNPPT